MEEEKLMDDEAKKQKERNNEEGAEISLAQQKLSQLSQTELTQSTQKKKKFKLQISWSKFQALIYKILRLKISNFK